MKYHIAAEKPMKRRPELQTKLTLHAPLYRHVFNSRFSSVVVLLLLSSILLQPIDRARASEGEVSTTTPAIIDTSTVSAATTSSQNPETQSGILPLAKESQPIDATTTETATAVVDDATSSLVDSSSTATVTATSDAPVDASAAPSTSKSEVPTSTLSIATSSLALVSATASQTVSEVATSILSTPTVTVHATPSLAVANKESLPSATLDTATSTHGEVIEAKATVTSDSQIQFDKSDCVAVADGSYYCKEKAPTLVSDIKDGLYSQPDADGDLEIYFARNGVLEQITHNQVDDASPFYDSISNTIVWHRLINDRYQIISYDVKTGSESQLTTDTVNNMEPARAGKYTAWQHWNKDNWDIMLNDGATTKLLTTVPEHDIAPKIRSNLVMWNRLANDKTQTIELYDLTTGQYTSIADTEGGEVSNPRMVLVYDAQFKNGDVVTKGYDVDTGKITQLTAIPVKIPDKIPAPDKTGETRALIQIKSTTREDSELSTTTPTIDPPVPQGGTTTVALMTGTTTIATTSPSLTIRIPALSDGATTTTIATSSGLTLDLSATSSLQITDSDVVVPAFTATSTNNVPLP